LSSVIEVNSFKFRLTFEPLCGVSGGWFDLYTVLFSAFSAGCFQPTCLAVGQVGSPINLSPKSRPEESIAAMDALFDGKKLEAKDGTLVDPATLATTEVVGLYFSAHWWVPQLSDRNHKSPPNLFFSCCCM